MTPSGDITRLAPIGVTHDHERLSDERLVRFAAFAAHATGDMRVVEPGDLASIIAECQEYRSPLVRARLAFAEATVVTQDAWKAYAGTSVGTWQRDVAGKAARKAEAASDKAFAALRAALATGGTDGK